MENRPGTYLLATETGRPRPSGALEMISERPGGSPGAMALKDDECVHIYLEAGQGVMMMKEVLPVAMEL